MLSRRFATNGTAVMETQNDKVYFKEYIRARQSLAVYFAMMKSVIGICPKTPTIIITPTPIIAQLWELAAKANMGIWIETVPIKTVRSEYLSNRCPTIT